ncbi:MAG: endopeptidase La, partial [Anaerolineae bacterium]
MAESNQTDATLFDDWLGEDLPPSEAFEEAQFPILPLRDTVLYPHMVAPLFVGRPPSVRAIHAAMETNQRVVVVAQRDGDVEKPTFDDLFTVGTEVVIGRMLRMPDGTTSIWVQGQRRVRMIEQIQQDPYFLASFAPIEETGEESVATEALTRAVLALFEKVVQYSHSLPDDAYIAAMNADEPGWLADLIASILELDIDERQELLEIADCVERLQRISVMLGAELDVLELENQIHDQVQQEVDRNQREYFLREQMRIIQSELGETDPYLQEIEQLRERVNASTMPDEARERAEKEVSRLAAMPSAAPEVSIIRTYVEWLLELPWEESTADRLDISEAAKVLDATHYGLPKAKERILEHLAVRQLAGDKVKSPILCFVGPPGTGKTSLGRSIADALGRRFVRVSLGGIRDEAEIRGHRRTYVGALPGRIIQTMRRAGTKNPVFMLDEIDKLGLDFRGDPASALLEVLDPEQNYAFSDHYLELPFDLSKVLFITTANLLSPIPEALEDRMEVIYFPGYMEEEKIQIAQKFLIPHQLVHHGLKQLQFSKGALTTLIREYTEEAGVRNLDREIANICRKVARRTAEGKMVPQRITRRALPKYLGPPRFTRGLLSHEDQIGV